ncbi:MAG: ABC transporter ATP-binding protein [Bdellovibrio sp.]|nr:MAG: ABC transporter ATP-binding protein [Bdellovibrio sp.]
MASPEIELIDVSFSFDEQPLLQNVSLSLPKGEVFVIMGPSGSGKSTLLKLMAGIYTPDQGVVKIEGEDLQKVKEGRRIKMVQRMGMLFQKNALFDSLTVFENVAFPLREVKALSEKEIHQRAEEFLDRVGLLKEKNLYPDEISGGMQKRLGIARALALDPEIVFYDDPTAGLDPVTSRKIIAMILELQKEKGSTVVAVTNDVHRAQQLAHRMGFMFGGQLIITGNFEQTLKCQDPRVHQFITGEVRGPLSEGVYDTV